MTWPALQTFEPWLASGARVVFILCAAWAGTVVLRRLLGGVKASAFRLMVRHAEGDTGELEKRAATIIGILQKTAVVLIWSVAVVMALREIGFDITPILAGAGVVGLAVGFGAQNLVRDVISGFFMLIENQIRVNDVVVINGTSGLVEEINLRTTVLRSQDGAVHVFPNGTITALSNMTREYSYYVFDISVAYGEDTDRVTTVLSEVADEIARDAAFADFILEPLEVLGVDRFADSAVIVRARIKTQPVRQWVVGREINRRLKKRFDEVGIAIPFPHTSVQIDTASRPLRIELDGATRDQIAQVVRDVLRDEQPAAPKGA